MGNSVTIISPLGFKFPYTTIAIALVLSIAFVMFTAEKHDNEYQTLKCATGISKQSTIIGEGNITEISPGTYRVERRDMPTQYVSKGMMDICVIANHTDNTSPVEKNSSKQDVDG